MPAGHAGQHEQMHQQAQTRGPAAPAERSFALDLGPTRRTTKALTADGKLSVETVVLPDGEEHKNMEVLEKVGRGPAWCSAEWCSAGQRSAVQGVWCSRGCGELWAFDAAGCN